MRRPDDLGLLAPVTIPRPLIIHVIVVVLILGHLMIVLPALSALSIAHRAVCILVPGLALLGRWPVTRRILPGLTLTLHVILLGEEVGVLKLQAVGSRRRPTVLVGV